MMDRKRKKGVEGGGEKKYSRREQMQGYPLYEVLSVDRLRLDTILGQ